MFFVPHSVLVPLLCATFFAPVIYVPQFQARDLQCNLQATL